MAFTGSAVIEQVADNLVRITGVSLAAQAAGAVCLFPFPVPGSRVVLPEEFKPKVFGRGPASTPVTLQASIEVTVNLASVVAYDGQVPLSIIKQGVDPTDFEFEITNCATAATDEPFASGSLEIYVRFH